MNSLIRSTTASLSRRFDGYEPLDHPQLERRALSKRKRLESRRITNSRSYRNQRAKQRRIFLKTYTLAPAEKLRRGRLPKPKGLKKLAAKVAKVVVSVLSFLRIGSDRLKSGDCRLAVRASSPTPVDMK